MADYSYLDAGLDEEDFPLRPWMIKQASKPDNKTKLTFEEDGGVTFKVKSPVEKPKTEEVSKEASVAAATPTPKTAPQIPFSAYASLMAPPTGPTAKELAGLTPEQIMGVMNMTGAMREAGRKTITDVEGWGMREAQRKLLEAKVREAMAPKVPTEQQVAMTELARARKKKLEEPEPGPSDLEKAQTEWKKAQTEALKAGKPPPKVPELEKKIQLAGVKTMRGFTHDKDGNVLDPEDVSIEGLTALDERLRKSNKKMIELGMPELVKDWAFDISGRPIYMVVDIGVTLDTLNDQDVANTLIGEYGYSKEDAKAVIKLWREGS